MSKKTKSSWSEPLLPGLDGDAVSLHTQNGDNDYDAGGPSSSGVGRRRYLDDVDDDAPELFVNADDMPPLYSDIAPASPAVLAGMDGPVDEDDVGCDDGNGNDADGRSPRLAMSAQHFSDGPGKKRRAWIGEDLDTVPEKLILNVQLWGRKPPRPYVQLRGTHSEAVERRGADGKTSTTNHQAVDFDVRVELTPLLYADANMRTSWRELRVAENYQRVRRGTVFACQGPMRRPDDDVEVPEPVGPSLDEWCHRFCDPSGPALRVFSVNRRMVGFGGTRVRAHLEKLVRRTNYRGHVQISFPVEEEGLDIYSEHRFNHWRQNHWIRLLFVVTGLIIFAWPYLFFMTKRYEVVTFEWPFSRQAVGPDGRANNKIEYVSLSEDQWYNLWARAIKKAVMSKHQGTLDQTDLRAAEGAQPTFESTGNNTVDGAMNLIEAGINAMNQTNQHLGWGGDC